MPVYEFICKECKKEFSIVRPIREADKKATCPKCESTNVERHWTSVFVETTRKS